MIKEFALPDVQVVRLRVKDLVPDPGQPRKKLADEALQDLARSLAETGQISPIVVRPGIKGEHIIVVGERRWRAAKAAGLQYIDCIIRDDLDDRASLEMQLAENYQREDVSPLDQARAFKAYMSKYRVTQRELSRRIGIPQRTISARLALLSLPVSMHAQIESGAIGPHEALKISELPSDKQEPVANAVASGRIGGRALEGLVKQLQAHPEKPFELAIGEITSAQSSPASSGDIRSADTSTAKVAAHETIDFTARTTNHTKEEEDIDLGNKPALAELLSKIRAFLDIAEEVGLTRQFICPHLKEDFLCDSCWAGEDTPEFLGEAVKRNGNWYLKPSTLLCALCTEDLSFRLDALEIEVENDPASGLRQKFKCTCGSTEELAVSVKCTKCGAQTWWGWWPEQS
jgi:ParB family chromosome partitioning protein